MSNDYFNFKNFTIHQKITKAKITTDSILIGALVNKNHNIYLDIGTGTGVIALMIASQNENAKIDALEIDVDSYNEAKYNFEISNWKNNINIIQEHLQNYEKNTIKKYDAIVCNPPFYNATFLSPDKARNNARQIINLPFEQLIISTKKLLIYPNGKFYVIIPFSLRTSFVNIALKHKLFLNEALEIIDNKKSIRILMQFSFNEEYLGAKKFKIRENNKYTDEYNNILKTFFCCPTRIRT